MWLFSNINIESRSRRSKLGYLFYRPHERTGLGWKPFEGLARGEGERVQRRGELEHVGWVGLSWTAAQTRCGGSGMIDTFDIL
jgi:hypothetical protein